MAAYIKIEAVKRTNNKGVERFSQDHFIFHPDDSDSTQNEDGDMMTFVPATTIDQLVEFLQEYKDDPDYNFYVSFQGF